MNTFLRMSALALVSVGLLMAAEPVSPPQLPLDVFFGGNTIRQPALSPNGRYLAWLQPANKRDNLVVLDRQLGKKTRITDMKDENVASFF